jgi:hypothetical protein
MRGKPVETQTTSLRIVEDDLPRLGRRQERRVLDTERIQMPAPSGDCGAILGHDCDGVKALMLCDLFTTERLSRKLYSHGGLS